MRVFTTSDQSDVDWKDRVAALRLLPNFLKLVYGSQRFYATAIALLRLLRALLPIPQLWVAKLIIEAVELHYRSGDDLDWNRLGALIVLEFGLVFGSDALARASSLLELLLGDLFETKMSIRLMGHAGILDLAQFEDTTTYDRLARAGNYSAARVALFVQLLDAVQAIITLMSLIVVLVVFVPWLLVMLTIAVIPAFFGETHYASLAYLLRLQLTPDRRRLEYLRSVATNNRTAKEVKLYGLSSYLVGRYSKLAWDVYEAHKRLSTRRAVVATGLNGLGVLGYYGAYATIIYLTVIEHQSPGGVFTIGVLTFLAASFRQSRALIQHILLTVARVYEQSLYVRDLLLFFELKPSVTRRPGALGIPRPIKQGFVFEGVGFRYPGCQEWAIRDLSFEVRPNESVALVGENGAGKTTAIKLLARLYDPEEGRILLDGLDLREYDPSDLWNAIAVNFQDFVRYSFLLRENIGVGDVARIEDETRIREAATRGLATAVAERLEHGFEQQLGREFAAGVELSGGEWQKVALSRAYMREAQVLILDEPTAALDARAEYEVFRRVTELARQKIALIISHRFSTVRVADRIMVLNRGRLVEEGVHDELVASGGEYAELFSLQAAGYR